MEMSLKNCGKELVEKVKSNKKILIKILIAKILTLIFIFYLRPPTNLSAIGFSDGEMYFNFTKNPKDLFKPPGTKLTPTTYVKPPGWPLFLLPFYTIYPNWIFWSIGFSFVFSFLALFLIYKISGEKIMWLFFFYPYFLYHSNFPLEVSVLSFLLTLAFYYLKLKNNYFFANLFCNLSSFFRLEGILISLYLLLKNSQKNVMNILLFITSTISAIYVYGYSHLLYNYLYGTPIIAYPRLVIPFLIPVFIELKEFFTKHFWKMMAIWVVFGVFVGYLKIFYIWNLL